VNCCSDTQSACGNVCLARGFGDSQHILAAQTLNAQTELLSSPSITNGSPASCNLAIAGSKGPRGCSVAPPPALGWGREWEEKRQKTRALP